VTVFVGCQFSLYPMTDRFVDVILSAVGGLKERRDLRVETDDLSTLLVGSPRAVFEAVQGCFLEAAATPGHVVLNATFSRGCPGEPDDPICRPQKPRPAGAPRDVSSLPASGCEVAAQFAVYPLGVEGYMEVIAREIEEAKGAGVFERGKHFCTRLGGDAARVFAAMANAFERAGGEAGHVVLTATVSRGSPTKSAGGKA
jgi:uncharacterized protein YqgV (UPF0045/DUF77 family)